MNEPLPDRALLEAVRAAPDDDAPRLVLADWLQERGSPWGELIAVQCALEHEARPAALAPLLRREQALLETRTAWWRYDALNYQCRRFRRGFPLEIYADNPAGLRDLYTRMPWLPDVDVVNIPLDVRYLLGLVRLPRLATRGFRFVGQLTGYVFDDKEAKLLLGWLERHAHAPRYFGWFGETHDTAMKRVLTHPSIHDSLEHFSAEYVHTTPDPEWFRGTKLRALLLEGLEMSQMRLDDELTRGLGQLDLRRTSWAEFVAPGIPDLTNLDRLGLDHCQLDDDQVAELLPALDPNRLTSLSLAGNRIGRASVERLAERPALKCLELRSMRLDHGAIEALARMALDELNLVAVELTKKSLRTLIASPTLPSTLRLHVGRSTVGALLPELQERFAGVMAY